MFTSLFPYVYFMIKDFHVTDDDTKISTYSGYLAASFAFTQFFCCVHWGRASDKVGRKPILLIGLTGSAICMFIFGFSKNFLMALLSRSAIGALNGNIAVLRTMIGEIATERRHQATAFSIIPVLWNVGSIIGPLIGGSRFFTRTGGSVNELGSFSEWHERFLQKHPYALSNIVVSMFLLLSSIIAILFLEETQSKAKRRRDVGLEIGDWIRRSLGFKVPLRPWQEGYIKVAPPYISNDESISSHNTAVSQHSENLSLISSRDLYNSLDEQSGGSSDDEYEAGSPEPLLRKRTSNALIRRYSTTFSMKTNESMDGVQGTFSRQIFTNEVMKTFVAGFLLSFHNLVFSEFFPVFLASDFLVDKLKFPTRLQGGFGYSSDRIGTLLASAGCLGIFASLIAFPIMDRYFKSIVSYRISCTFFPVAYGAIAFLIYTTHDYNPAFPKDLTKTLLYVICCTLSLGSGTAFPQSIILIHRSAPPRHRAFVNGCAMSLNALARCVSPLIWGSLMSYLDSKSLGQLPWLILSIIAFGSWIQAFTMDDYDKDLELPQTSLNIDNA